MAITSRTAQSPCIYWVGGKCTADLYFSQSTITCYNIGDCDNFGTCLDCSKYDGPGLKISNLSYDDVSTNSTDYTQTPVDIRIYNLRAKLQKCCNWDGAPTEMYVDASGNILPSIDSTNTKCIESRAADWHAAWSPGSQHTTTLPCNGAKSSCPYYTGPNFQYITDEKMEKGQSVSAAQIMELRYYSKDWTEYNNPRAEYERLFSQLDIWAWYGTFDDAPPGDPTEDSIPTVTKVTLFESAFNTADTFSSALYIGGPRVGATGTRVLGSTPNYPDLIGDISDTVSRFEISWPSGSHATPYVFRTFRIGANQIYVIVNHNSEYPVYAVNMTKHPQRAMTDEAFIEYMLNNHPDDIQATEADTSILGSVFAVELEYQPEVNELKVFTNKTSSSNGTMYTDRVYVQHKFYHAHVAQTSFKDNYGQAVVEPWIDRFLDFEAEASIFQLSSPKNTVDVESVLWDTVAYDKSTIYETQHEVTENNVPWEFIYCDVVAITVEDTNANPVQQWTVSSGTQTSQNLQGVSLGIWADRTGNPNLATGEPTTIEMEVLSKSESGIYHPANVIFAKPKDGHYGFDEAYDTFKVTFAYTKYNQGPIPDNVSGDLKYPERAFTGYIEEMPYELTTSANKTQFSVKGLTLPVYTDGVESGRLGVSDFEDFLVEMETEIDANEQTAIKSFAAGGSNEGAILAVGEVYLEKRTIFNNEYQGKKFFDGTSVTLQNLCTKLGEAGYYEGTQEYRVTFKDETGRPIGIKRLYFLMQSAVPSCRDVEIYYQWKTEGVFINIDDQVSLLARDYGGLKKSPILRNFSYTPKCGDHSLQFRGQTFYEKFEDTDQEIISWENKTTGQLEDMLSTTTEDSGPLWYPYKQCTMPTYYQDDVTTTTVLCSAHVEGFGEGLRREYWEKTRGNDIYWSFRVAIQTIIGCTWSWVDADYQTVKTPVFAGFTRIRSNHLMGPYQTDREAVRLSRHYRKRNLAVRNEWVRPDDANGSLSLSSDGTSFLFNTDGSSKTDEKPIWIHEIDSVSFVNRTTSSAKSPFANLRLVSTGEFPVGEVYDPTRRKLSDIMKFRDLVKNETRDENGDLVYSPEEPLYSADEGDEKFEEGKDIYWVFKSQDEMATGENPPSGDIVWAWMERQKDPERAIGGGSIGGVFVYNPQVNAFKKNFESATFMDDGDYLLEYTAPTFGGNGNILSNPTLSFAGGPPREVDWNTGVLLGAPASFGADPYDAANHSSSTGATFQLFGKVTSDGNGFLADSSGKHTFELDGTSYETFRGISIKPKVLLSLLPTTKVEAISAYTGSVRAGVLALSANYSKKTYEIDLNGSKQMESLYVEYQVGPDALSSKVFAFPSITLDGQLPSDAWSTGIASLTAQPTVGVLLTRTQATSFTGKYKKLRLNIGGVPQKQFLNITDIAIYIKEPIGTTETIRLYNQMATVSIGNIGNQHPSDLYYYYARTFTDFGLSDVNYSEVEGSGPTQQDLKWQSRSVRDILVTYSFMDPTGTIFDYPKAPVASIPNIENEAGAYKIGSSLQIHTKGQTVIANAPVSDPINAETTGLTWSQTVAPDETSKCSNAKSEGVPDENLQECLYQEAKDLIGPQLSSVYESFWHPDEEDFFLNQAAVAEMPSWTLTLMSYVAPFNRVMRHPAYGCNKRYSNEYHDGRVHTIPPWRPLGHLLYLGSPVWNWTCTAVIMQKLRTHLGEDLFGSQPAAYVASQRWPPDYITNVKLENPDFYMENEQYHDNPLSYAGGTMSTGMPIRVSQALNYLPGGQPRGWLQELSAFPQTRQWPIGSGPVSGGFAS